MRLPTDLYLAGAAAWLPPAVSAKQVAANGGYSEEELTANGIVCAPEGDDSPPEMAARAAATPGAPITAGCRAAASPCPM